MMTCVTLTVYSVATSSPFYIDDPAMARSHNMKTNYFNSKTQTLIVIVIVIIIVIIMGVFFVVFTIIVEHNACFII